MDNLTPFDRPSIRRYRHQRFWQIILPIVLFSILITATGGFVIAASSNQNRLWADISIIWLVLPLLIIALIFLLFLIGMIFIMVRLTKGIPRIALKIQMIFVRIEQEACRFSNSVVKPVLWWHQFQSGFQSLMKKIKPAGVEGKNNGSE